MRLRHTFTPCLWPQKSDSGGEDSEQSEDYKPDADSDDGERPSYLARH